MLLQALLLFTWIDHSPIQYGEYVFPAWATGLGWVLSFSSVTMIPLVAVVKLFMMDYRLTLSQVCLPFLQKLRGVPIIAYFEEMLLVLLITK